MEGIKFETEEDMQEFLNNFIDDYNQKLSSQQELDSYDYLEMAQEADDKADAIKYAKKALAHSIEEVILAFYENSFLYDTMDYFAGDLYKELDIE
ncbi:MAG: hypothetical protein IJZ90_01740 [Clostridia bacterium]|nr:hypothetical protein [Clostridia bacterium]